MIILLFTFEKQSDTVEAIEIYEKSLGFWKDADPGIPEVGEVRKKLKK